MWDGRYPRCSPLNPDIVRATGVEGSSTETNLVFCTQLLTRENHE